MTLKPEIKTIISALKGFNNSITLVDTSQPDQPLIFVNEKFCQLTGYSKEEILGKNCRFLQGTKTNKSDINKVAQAIANERAIFCDLLNYKKDGTEFFNRLTLLPLKDNHKTFFLGLQSDSSLFKKELTENFDQLKSSEDIKDMINTPLMKLYMYTSPQLQIDSNERAQRTTSVLSEISQIVLSL